MASIFKMTRILAVNIGSIEEAASVLKQGGLVGMPTETVYGLAANALDSKAVARVFEAKGRPSINPLIVHVNDVQSVQKLAEMKVDDIALAERFWPGPMTLILKRKADSGLSDLVSAGLPTVAVRIPSHKTARALIKACGFPIAAPSANKSGSLSPTRAQHVAQSLGDVVDFVIADGPSTVGLESTVIDCTGDLPYILRPGGVTSEDASECLGRDVLYHSGEGEAVKSPGQLLKHYAPSIPVRLNAVDLHNDEALLSFGSTKFMGLREGGGVSNLPEDQVRHLSRDGDLYEAASNLFAMMRALDNKQYKGIAVMNIPDVGIGVAINDRLKRAAQG